MLIKQKTVALLLISVTFIISNLKVSAFHSYQDTLRKYVPGKSYIFKVSSASGENVQAVEYIAGDAKSRLILTSPHGGSEKPAFMRSRTKDYTPKKDDQEYGNAESFTTANDGKSQELTREIADEIKRITGLRPHIILNNLDRSKLDGNRGIGVAAQGDPNAELAWKAFHQFIDDAKKQVAKNGAGLLIDVHGNGHRPQRTEVGLLLKGKDFSEENLEQFAEKSSISAMVKSDKTTMTELIKGKTALGTLLVEEGIVATPSATLPDPIDAEAFPGGQYFNGGYITARHGSKFSGRISAIQTEFNQSVRFDDSTRPTYAKAIARAFVKFVKIHFK